MAHAVAIEALQFHCACGAAKPLRIEGLYLPGMYAMARCSCPLCGRKTLSHLPLGWNGRNPLTVDAVSHQLTERVAHVWYHDWAEAGLKAPDRTDYAVEIKRHRRVRRPVIVNCIDHLYGHCLHRLFAIEGLFRAEPKADVVLIIPRFLAWLEPPGIAETWIVDVPLRSGNGWLTGLADKLAPHLAGLPKPRYLDMWGYDSVDVSNFTGINKFPSNDTDINRRPRLTLIWREDRLWTEGAVARPAGEGVAEQARLYGTLCQSLRAVLPELDAAVVGFGNAGRFPDWVADQRVIKADNESERSWCQRFARSHMVFGVHGSNMILPAAHANTALVLVPADMYWHVNVTWEFINQRMRANDALAHFQNTALSTSVADVLTIAYSLLIRSAQRHAYRLMNAAASDLEYRRRQAEAPWVWQVPVPIARIEPQLGPHR